jgi:hypothetical protein
MCNLIKRRFTSRYAMTSSSEYHVPVRRFLPFPVALFGVALLALVSAGMAQTNGMQAVPAGHPTTGAVISPTGPVIPPTGSVRPATGTVPSVSPERYNSHVTFSGSSHIHSYDGHQHHRGEDYAFPFFYAVPVPYAVDPGAAENTDDADDDEVNYQGGPTVFDRRGYGADSYVPPVDSSEGYGERTDLASTVPEPPQPTTLLVFKDGHTIELGNYAIIGANLFDLTPGHTRKVPLTDIDLAATERQNDDRGVTFALPTTPQAN